MSTLLRRAAVAAVAVLLGCLGLAAPAWADPPTADNVGPVVVSPVHSTAIDLSGAVTGTDPLTFSVVDQPSQGSVTFDDPNVATATFTPTGPPSGSDFFTYQVSDGTDTSNTAVVALTVNHVPTAQDAGPFKVSPVQPTQIDLTGSAADADQDPLTYTVVAQPSDGHSTVSFADPDEPTATFTPSGNPSASETFTYSVSDGIDTSSTRTITVDFNHVPSASGLGPIKVSPVNSTDIALGTSASDQDSDPLTFTVVTQPAHGSVKFDGSTATFVPTGTPTGTDSFKYRVNDGTDDSNTATVSLTYNHVPTASDDGPITVSPVNASTINLAGKAGDGDSDPLTYSVVTPASKGIASFSGAVAHYVPSVQAAGTDSFGYQATDGIDTSAARTVSLTFNQVPTASNDGSAASPIKIAAQALTSINLASFAADADGDPLTFSPVAQPVHGSVTFAGGGSTAKFTPTGTPTGSDSFTFRVSDGIDFSNTATVTVVYNAVPQAQNKSLTVSGIDATDIALTPLVSDADGDALTFTHTAPAFGTVTGTSTAHFVPPADGSFGTDPFTYTVSDGLDSATATINLRVNDVPVAVGPSGTVSVPFNSPGKAIPLSVTDRDTGETHTFTIVNRPASGSVQLSGSTATYTPVRGATGPDSFSFEVTDGIDTSAPHTVNVDVAQAPDQPPTASAGSATVAFDGKVAITLHATDPDGDPLVYSVKQAQHGSVSTGHGATRTYTADSGFAGKDSFTFTAKDPSGKSDTAIVSITVSKAPTAVQSVQFSPSNPTPGKDVTAQVALSTPGSVRGGTLTLQDGSHKYPVTMSSKTVTVELGKLSAGSHTFTVRYGGTSTTSSTSATALPIKVAKAASSLRVSSTPKQLTTRDRGVATVRVSAGGAPVDGAVVTIKEGSNTLGSAVVRDGVAKITLPKFGLGQHNLVVSYAGNADVTSATKSWTVRVALG